MDWVLASIAFVAFPAAVLPGAGGSPKACQDSYTKRKPGKHRGAWPRSFRRASRGAPIVKAFGMEQYELARFNRENREVLRHSMKASRAPRNHSVGHGMHWRAMGFAGVLWYGGNVP